SAIARTPGCASPVGAEQSFDPGCSPACTNQPATCAAAFPSVATLWPPDGRFVDVDIEGVVDPEGGALGFENALVLSDERTGAGGSDPCPDAFVVGGNRVKLRAQRDANGDGRVYLASFRVVDQAGAECIAQVEVCVPRKPGISCVKQEFLFSPVI